MPIFDLSFSVKSTNAKPWRALILATCVTLPAGAAIAACGNTAAGFENWKTGFAQTARKAGVKRQGLQALASARYATRTISADRNQKSFRYTLDKFLEKPSADISGTSMSFAGLKKVADRVNVIAYLDSLDD